MYKDILGNLTYLSTSFSYFLARGGIKKVRYIFFCNTLPSLNSGEVIRYLL